MQVNSVLSNYQVPAKNTTTTNNANGLDSDQFMQILMAQLTHQNPLEPMDNSEMLSQFSQLNSVQELRNIHATMDALSTTNQTTYLTSLIGKTVKAQGADGNVVEGVVDGVITNVANPQVRIGTQTANLADVLEVSGK